MTTFRISGHSFSGKFANRIITIPSEYLVFFISGTPVNPPNLTEEYRTKTTKKTLNELEHTWHRLSLNTLFPGFGSAPIDMSWKNLGYHPSEDIVHVSIKGNLEAFTYPDPNDLDQLIQKILKGNSAKKYGNSYTRISENLVKYKTTGSVFEELYVHNDKEGIRQIFRCKKRRSHDDQLACRTNWRLIVPRQHKLDR